MKVIDLLNKIANGEEIPIYFKVNNIKFKYEDEHQLYNDLCEDWIYLNDEVIIDEVEIIEEDKKIPEKLGCCSTDLIEVDIIEKINEIIDYLEEKEQ